MRLKYLVPILVIVVFLAVSTQVSARMVHDFDCANCHKAGAELTSVASTVCLDCHNSAMVGTTFPLFRSGPGDTNPISNNTFAVGDASDAMGSVTAQGQVPGDQTSHNWAAPDRNLAAGATAPSDYKFFGRQNYSGSNVTCGRCHDPHGASDSNPKLLKLGQDSELAMCNDCHITWAFDTAPSEGGSAPTNVHPMVTNYAAIAAAKPTEYNDVAALDAAPGEIALNGTGGIDCLSCHGVHWTDSHASTTDGAGQALNAGDGKILKADGPGVDGSNLCQTCHKYAEHGLNRSGGANAIGCLICHGAHLEDVGGLMNNYMLREDITTYLPKDAASGSVTGLTANLTSTPALGERLWNYCFTCHDSADAVSGHINTWDCTACHSHSDATGSWTASGGCNTCHGYPPSENVVSDGNGGNAGYAAGYASSGHFKNETNTQHTAHAGGGSNYSFACADCHINNNHLGGDFADVFLAPITSYVEAGGQLSPTYVAASGACSAVYCHSNGGPRGAVPTVNNPGVWEGGAAINSCDACHGNDATDMVTRNNSATHIAHLNKGYSCQVCHTDTADNATTLAAGAISGSHVDGDADVAFDATSLSFGLGSTSYGTNGTCSVYCHSNSATNATPDWDLSASGACGTCHQYNNSGVATGSGPALGGAHTAHLFAAAGPKIASCSACHTHDGATGAANSDHVNGVKNVDYNACDACHGTDGVSSSGADRMPVWTDANTVDCETCHSGSNIAVIGGNAAPAKTNFSSLGHGDSGLTSPPACDGCHNAGDAGHFDGVSGDDKRLKVDPQADGGAEDYATSATAWCQDCHGENAHFNNTNTTGGSSSDGDSCILCHEPHGDGMGSNTDAMLIVGANFTDRTAASSYFNGSNNGVCQVCHDPAEVGHYNTAGDDGHNAATACYTCHSHSSTPQAFQGGKCYECHGDGSAEYWPQAAGNDRTVNELSDFNDAGRHQKHMEVLAAKLGYTLPGSDAEQKQMCSYCHVVSDGDHAGLNNGFADVFPSGGAKKIWDAGNDADATWNTTNYNTCSNIDCHNSKETLDGSYGWYDATTTACLMCHNDMTDTGIATGQTHAAHTGASAGYGLTINCASCHDAATNWSTNTQPAAGHIDGNFDMGGAVSLSYLGSLPPGSSFGSCGTNACHEDGKGGTPVANSYTWGTAEASACGICHKSSMDSAAHDEHLDNSSYVTGCTECHTAATAATHINDSVNFDGSKVAYSSGTGTCAINVCHAGGDFRDSSPSPGCENCHSGTYIAGDNTGTGGNNYLPQYNMHVLTPTVSGAVHKTITSCGFCHENIYSSLTHIDGTWETDSADNSSQNRGIFNTGIPLNFVDGSPATCTTVCHFGVAGDGGTWARRWSGTAGNNDGTECGNCHGDFTSGFVTGISARHSSDAQLAASHGGASTPCMTCHTLGDGGGDYDWATQHRDGNIQLSNDLGWVDHGATVGCSNCHSDNDDADDSMSDGEHEMEDTYKDDAPDDGSHDRWGRVFQNGGGGSCTSCHDANGGDHGAGTENATLHTAHLSSDYIGGTCTNCHPHTGPGTPGDGGKHNDGTVDFGGTYMTTAADYAKASNFGGSCAAANGCHDSDAGEWAAGDLANAADNACQDCHGAASGYFSLLSAWPPNTDAHADHINNDDLVPNDCTDCHGADAATGAHATHYNTTIETGSQVSTYTSGDGTCTNSCHTVVDGRDWTSGVTLSCADCHDATGKSLDQGGYPPTSAEHNAHLNNSAAVPNDCTDCHGTDATAGDHADHKNGVKNVASQVSVYTSGDGTCTNTCHTVVNGRDWTSGTTLNCADCHSSGKSLDGGGESDLSASVGPNAGRHDAHMGSSLTILSNGCTDCHGHSGTLGNYGTTKHVNGSMNFNASKLSSFASPDCTNVCHDVNPGTNGDWADSAALHCVDCHSNSPTNYIGPEPTSGLHAPTNIQDHAIKNDALFNCAGFCHPSSGEPTNKHMDNTTQNTTAATYSWGIGISSYDRSNGCAGSCHMDGGAWLRKWEGAVDVVVTTAMSPGSPVCANCHGDFDSGFNTGVAGRHTGTDADGDIQANHQGAPASNDCYLCHAWGHTAYTSISGPAAHRDQKIQVNSASKVGFVDNGATVGCANCHASNDGTADEQHAMIDTSKSGGLNRWDRVLIEGPEGNCDTCHSGNIGTGLHGDASDNADLHAAHNISGYIDTNSNYSAGTGATYDNCTTCHGHNGSGGTHNNGTVNFDGSNISSSYNYAKGSSFGGSCGNTNGCHDSNSGEWASGDLSSGGDNACQDCHGSSAATFFEGQVAGLDMTWQTSPAGPTTTKHDEHLSSSYSIGCNDCHGVNAATGGHTGHKNKAIDDAITYVGGSQTCTNSCHLANTSGDWTGGGSLACDDCHGAANSANTYYRSRTSGSHSSHVATGTPPSTYGSTTNNSSGSTYDFGCGQCHPTSSANHLNGSSREIQAGINYSGGATGSCSSNSCHQDGQGGAPATVPTWGTAFTGDSCNKCHGNAPATGAHSAHAVGIHADDLDDSDGTTEGIYSGTSGNIADSGSSPSAHGDGTTSTVLSCLTCHYSTVSVWYNALNSDCLNCHDTSSASLGDNAMVVTDTSNHLNGSTEVAFQNIQFKSKAQVREDITGVTELNDNWTRTNGYKAASSYDLANTSLSAASYNSGDSSCSAVSCHNGIQATWTAPTGDCTKCHTSLPQ